MPIVVSPSTVRHALQGSWVNGQKVVTIFHTYFVEAGHVPTGSQVFAAGNGLINAFQDNFMSQMPSIFTLEGVTSMSLHTQDGDVTFAPPNAAKPLVGTLAASSSAAQPPSMCTLIKKRIQARRGFRSGRWYCPNLLDNDVDNVGKLLAARQTAIQTAATAFFTAAAPAVEGHNAASCVVHAPFDRDNPPEIVFGAPVLVTGFLVDPVIASQRRRVRD